MNAPLHSEHFQCTQVGPNPLLSCTTNEKCEGITADESFPTPQKRFGKQRAGLQQGASNVARLPSQCRRSGRQAHQLNPVQNCQCGRLPHPIHNRTASATQEFTAPLRHSTVCGRVLRRAFAGQAGAQVMPRSKNLRKGTEGLGRAKTAAATQGPSCPSSRHHITDLLCSQRFLKTKMKLEVDCRQTNFFLASAPPPCDDIPSGRCFFMGPWTVTRSSLRTLRRVAAFCRPLRPVLLLVSFPRSRSPVVWCAGAVLNVAGCAVSGPQ